MSKPLNYATIPVGCVCVPLLDYILLDRDKLDLTRKNIELSEKFDSMAQKIHDLEAQIETLTDDRDSKADAFTYWADRCCKFESEVEKLKKQLQETANE